MSASPAPELDFAAAAVEAARRAGATDADAWLNAARNSEITIRDGDIETLNDAATRTLVLRVFAGDRTAMTFAADPGRDDLERLAAEAVALARLVDSDPCVGLPDGPFATNGASDRALDLYDPAIFAMDGAAAVDVARRADAAARGHDRRMTASGTATFTRREGTIALANSRGFAESYPESYCTVYVSAYADDADGKKREGWGWATDRRLADLEAAESVGEAAARRALRRLGARKVPTQEAPVVWAPEAAVALVEILGEAASGAMRYSDATFLIGREGEQVASSLVTIVDDPTVPGRPGSRPFDGEGLPARRTPIFEDGRFVSFLHDANSARRAGQAGTASAGRGSNPVLGPTVGITPSNLCLLPGPFSPEEVIAGVERGLYVTDLLGAAENLATGDFSRGAAGLWIEDGALAYPVDEINIAGHLTEMLAGIDAVGTDAQFLNTVSAPTIRIARMTIGGS
jgi:PmbA protein